MLGMIWAMQTPTPPAGVGVDAGAGEDYSLPAMRKEAHTVVTSAPFDSAASTSSPSPHAPGAAAAAQAVSIQRLWSAVMLNWIVPGSGYFLVGERTRAWVLLIVLNATFAMGLTLKGSVVVPEFNVRSPTFNFINVLTFVVDLGAGGPALSCIAARNGLAEGDLPGGIRGWFAGNESSATYDLGAFHLLLVGALNYFACCALYDRFRHRREEKT